MMLLFKRLIILCLVLSINSFADEKLMQNGDVKLTKAEKEYIQNKKIIYVSNETDYEPLDFAREGVPQGFSVELIELLLKDTGLKVEFVTDKWENLLEDLNQHKIDLVSTIYKTPKREKKYNFSLGYLRETYHYIVCKNDKEIENISQLFGKKVGVSKGWSEEEFINKYPQIKKVYFKNIEEKLAALNSEKIDAIINGKSVANYYITKYGYVNLKISNPIENSSIIGKNTFHFAALKDQPELISIINKRFQAISVEKLEGLQQKWFGSLSKYQYSFNQKEQNYLRSEYINICVQNGLYPYIKVSNNKLVGILADLFNPIFNKYQTKYNLLKIDSSSDLFKKIKGGQCDVVIPFLEENDSVK